MSSEIPKRWYSFLTDLDDNLDRQTGLVCIGGFVIAMQYDLERETSDLDFITCIPEESGQNLRGIAGKGSQLHKKHKVYLDQVTVAQTTECYEDRLTEIFKAGFKHLRLFSLDPYDLALTKLERNSQKDREDVLRMAGSVEFDLEEFKERYETEFKVYVEDGRHASTFDFWIELIEEQESSTEAKNR